MRSKNSRRFSGDRLYSRALALLTGRDYSVAALTAKLSAVAENAGEVDDLIPRLKNEGYLDDLKYAERFAELARSRGLFGERLKIELRRKGIAKDIRDRLVECSGRADEEAVYAVLNRHFPCFCFETATDREKRRVFSFLQRRGIPASLALKCMQDRHCTD